MAKLGASSVGDAAMTWSIDLNCDMGERETAEGEGDDVRIMGHISSANIACGGHAGSRRLMRATVREAIRNGVTIGAHPSFRDRLGFGRVPQALTLREIVALVEEQVLELAEIAREEGGRVQHVKPHGALYHLASEQREVGMAVLEAIGRLPFACHLMGFANSRLEGWAGEAGIPFLREFFADRNYRGDGSLVPRSEAGAMVGSPEEAAQRVLRVLETGGLVIEGGGRLPIQFDSVCIHSDTNHRDAGHLDTHRSDTHGDSQHGDSQHGDPDVLTSESDGVRTEADALRGGGSRREERGLTDREEPSREGEGRGWYIAAFRRWLEGRGVAIQGPPACEK